MCLAGKIRRPVPEDLGYWEFIQTTTFRIVAAAHWPGRRFALLPPLKEPRMCSAGKIRRPTGAGSWILESPLFALSRGRAIKALMSHSVRSEDVSDTLHTSRARTSKARELGKTSGAERKSRGQRSRARPAGPDKKPAKWRLHAVSKQHVR